MNIKFHTLFTSSLVLFTIFITPTKALAVPIQNLNGQTGQIQTFQNDSNLTISSSSNIHSLGWQGLLPISRGGTGSSSFTNGSVPFIFNGIFSQDNSNFFWDNTNKRLGIGTSSPTTALDVSGNAKATSLTSTSDSTINSLNIGLGGGSVPTNLSLGPNALSSNTIGSRNLAIGSAALSATLTASDNTAVGFVALGNSSNSGSQNTAVGSRALSGNTTGSFNSAYGLQALLLNTSGERNVAIGNEALNNNTTGSNNVALGFRSMTSNTTTGANVAIGDLSAAFLSGGGGGNIVIGQAAATRQADGSTVLSAADHSIYIGSNVQGYDNNDDNSIVIGTGAAGAGANKTVIGNSAMADVYFGSANANANIHAKKLFLGSSIIPGCIIMGDTAGGVGYITLTSGVLTASTTPPTACQ